MNSLQPHTAQPHLYSCVAGQAQRIQGVPCDHKAVPLLQLCGAPRVRGGVVVLASTLSTAVLPARPAALDGRIPLQCPQPTRLGWLASTVVAV